MAVPKGQDARSARPDLADPTDGLTLSQAELVERIGWLLKLRWLAFVGVSVTILVTRYGFRSHLPYDLLLFTALSIAGYNTLFSVLWSHGTRPGKEHIDRLSVWLANAQISCDLVVLGMLIHLSGGLENLFGFYFVFHMVIASMLLSRRAAFAQATLALSVFATVVVGEYFTVLPHHVSPVGMQVPGLHDSGVAVLAALWVMATSLYVTVYFATSIAARLRWREGQVVELSRELAANAEQLQAACEQLTELEKAKSAYARKVAHELRSPLAAIDSLLRVVVDGLQGDVSVQARETLGRARSRAHELLELVRDLLAMASAREARQPAQVCDVDLRALTEEVVRLLSSEAERRGITVNCEVCNDMPCIRCDREAIEEVLTNLVSNAIKYSHDGGRVDVRVSRSAGSVEVEVSDTGIGIEESELPRVFDEFYRGSAARSHTTEGTGLGLAIAKTIVESHGGTIHAESSRGVGSTLRVRLPSLGA